MMMRILTQLGRLGIMTVGEAWQLPIRVVLQAWDLRPRK